MSSIINSSRRKGSKGERYCGTRRAVRRKTGIKSSRGGSDVCVFRGTIHRSSIPRNVYFVCRSHGDNVSCYEKGMGKRRATHGVLEVGNEVVTVHVLLQASESHLGTVDVLLGVLCGLFVSAIASQPTDARAITTTFAWVGFLRFAIRALYGGGVGNR